MVMRLMSASRTGDGSLRRAVLIVITLALSFSGPRSFLAGELFDRTTTGVAHASAAALAPQDFVESTGDISLPIRAAFYYPWFPEGWQQRGTFPYTRYEPTNGYYDSGDEATIRRHIEAMQYGRIQAGIASWWGAGTPTDLRVPTMLAAARDTGFRWALYHETEGVANPSSDSLSDDLVYIRDHYAQDPGYLRIDGRFVVFVYAESGDDCGMVDRWHRANIVNAYIVLRVFPGFSTCGNQPDGWHQYAPAEAADSQAGYSYSISPGFWKVGEPPRLTRDPERWARNVRDMVASGAPFQLITSFNEWGEGTAIEAGTAWASPSGYGQYLDVLHAGDQSLHRGSRSIGPVAFHPEGGCAVNPHSDDACSDRWGERRSGRRPRPQPHSVTSDAPMN